MPQHHMVPRINTLSKNEQLWQRLLWLLLALLFVAAVVCARIPRLNPMVRYGQVDVVEIITSKGEEYRINDPLMVAEALVANEKLQAGHTQGDEEPMGVTVIIYDENELPHEYHYPEVTCFDELFWRALY